MNSPGKVCVASLLGLLSCYSASLTFAAGTDDLAWPPVTAQTRPWTWWWWHGSAVDPTNISEQLTAFHQAGLGGVQITTIYGTKGAEARDIPYLSPHWLTMMGCTVDQARKLGMGVDMSLGSGWCFGGPTVTSHDANASVLVKTFNVAAGGKIDGKIDRETTQSLMAFSADGQSVDLTGKISADGQVDWTAPMGNWTVYAISQRPSGQKVKRPAPGGEGWMLNPAYPQAMRDWLPWFDKAFASYDGPKPQAVFQDSYEYRTDWAPDFFAQFQKLRGYKLQTELPALFADTARTADSMSPNLDSDHIGRVKYDYRQTLSEIMATESEPIWINWAQKNGFETIYQAHGTPGNWLDLYGDSDMPETEMFHNDRSILISKFASSAAHTQGHPLTGAETGTWLKEHFTVTLADLKYLADDMFLSGVNHIYYHGTCYSPDDAPWPGWLFYASTEMNPRNSIWHDVPALNEYIARSQSILQSGQPDADVLLYWPVADFWSQPDGLVQPMAVGKAEWFEGQPIGKTAHELWNRGCAFDYVSDAQLSKAKAVDGKIQMPGGSYQVIVVPKCKYMPLETFKQLLNLADGGATIVFEDVLPGGVAGWGDLKAKQAEFAAELLKVQFRDVTDFSLAEDKYGRGRLFRTPLHTPWESFAGVKRERMADSGLSFIRRKFDGGWNYFIANRTDTNFDGWITLGRPAKSVVLLDPMTGAAGVAATQSGAANGTEVRMQLRAGESVFARAFATEACQGPEWAYREANGKPIEIPGNWTVQFIDGGPSLPADFETSKLTSWTDFPDTNCQAFAGTAEYKTTFDAPAAAGETFALDLGEVRQSARVRLNGKDYGTLFTPPFHVMVDNLKPTGNVLEVQVTSVAANRIRDLDRRGVKWKIFKDINIVDINYHPFDASQWPLTDCGLLGPVTIAPTTGSK